MKNLFINSVELSSIGIDKIRCNERDNRGLALQVNDTIVDG